MSDAFEFFICTPGHWNRISQAAVDQIVGRAMKLLAEIRDPKSGEQAEVTQTPLPYGVKIVVRGSEFIRAEAWRRMSTPRP